MVQDLLVFNGIDTTTGAYLQSPMSAGDVSPLARGETLDPERVAEFEDIKYGKNSQRRRGGWHVAREQRCAQLLGNWRSSRAAAFGGRCRGREAPRLCGAD
jgi:hypothetical protein